MKRIGIYVYTEPSAGGAYQYTRSIMQAVQKITEESSEYDAVVYSYDTSWEKVCEELQVSFELLTSSLFKKIIFWGGHIFSSAYIHNFLLKYADPLWSRYRRRKLDLLIISGPVLMEKTQNAKIITPIYDIMQRYIDFPEVGGGQLGIKRDEGYIDICYKSDGILVDSALGKKQVIECYGQLIDDLVSKVFILPYIAADYIYEEGEVIEPFDKYILYPAQFWKHKNHIRLVHAVAQLRKKGLIINLVLTGTEKNNKKNVERLIQELDLQEQIKILDYVTNSQLVYLYKHARALAMPTFAGPTNIPPLEALAVGCPMMLSNNFAMSEQAGNAALYFNPESTDEIADCMEKLWIDDELRTRLIANGAIQRDKWGIDQFQQRLKEIIDSVIAG